MEIVNEPPRKRRLVHNEHTRLLNFEEDCDLELFQKEAIWRRTHEYDILLLEDEKAQHIWNHLLEKFNHYVLEARSHHQELMSHLQKVAFPLVDKEKTNDIPKELSLEKALFLEKNDLVSEDLLTYFSDYDKILKTVISNGILLNLEEGNVSEWNEWIQEKESHFLMTFESYFQRLKLALLKKELTLTSDRQHSAELEWKQLQQQKITQELEQSIEQKKEQTLHLADSKDGSEPLKTDVSLDDDNVVKLKNNFDSQSSMMKRNVDQRLNQLLEKQKEAAHLYMDLLSAADRALEKTPEYQGLQEKLLENEKNVKTVSNQLASIFSELQTFISQRTKTQIEDAEQKMHEIKGKQARIEELEKSLTSMRTERDGLVVQQQMLNTNDVYFQEILQALSLLSDSKKSILEAHKTKLAYLEWVNSFDLQTDEGDQKDDEVEKISRNNACLEAELPGMHLAFNKAYSKLKSNLDLLQNSEEAIKKAHYDKSRAAQKYFSAMKSRDLLITESKTLKSVSSKGQDYISKLSERENMLARYHSSLKEMEDVYKQIKEIFGRHTAGVLEEDKRLQTRNSDLEQSLKSLRESIDHIREDTHAAHEKHHSLQIKEAQFRLKDEYNQKESALIEKAFETAEAQVYKGMLKCQICEYSNWKNRLIPSCGHAFCSTCLESRLRQKDRTCPICETAFNSADIVTIHL
ncbi:histone H2B-K119 ubiquitin ligase complex (HULC) subunit, ubiquitin-protein ligase E3 Brl1 [Schizosaccharomyces osmophilus]|uniref:E3 ubiquitin protein ligase n=1 Tax=Schizosaccharomyces osmophilus TaxID=2545709 RepID=A0AAF0AYU2_9SCHI|nr:histone H2B-K119 ubiquitin ligase complex (HULC) subunit, ubiquitin-protein ligase E3 Brl1 [Schizosaccharomyces osmophilus]WBW74869.1 histone H2B-K119 ubiquitin ligase complex (HULC) subunit, ubiquitin-protein ligase E3 Brl1 [Schizosaccharomyces osmophilus]